MCRRLPLLALTLAALVVQFSPLRAAPPPELPVATFFANPAMVGLEFSPDGQRILAVVPWEGRRNLMVIDLARGRRDLLSSFRDKDVLGPFWANDDRILFLVDQAGTEEYELYAVNSDGSRPSVLQPTRSMTFLRRLPNDPRSILVQAAITHRDWYDVAGLDIRTGKLSRPIAKAPGDVDRYLLDRGHMVRVAVVNDATTGTVQILHRAANGEDWTEIHRTGFDQPGWLPIAFDGDDRTLWVSSNVGRATRAIYRFDTMTGVMANEPVFADDSYDVDSVLYDESKHRVVGVFYEADRRRYHWLDPEMQAIHERMERALPGTVHHPVQFAANGSNIIFFSYSDRDPGVYYLYDRARQRVDELAVVQPDIDPDQMASMRPISYFARDGLPLHGYLTLPRGREARNLPLIVHPHGGPYGIRDTWEFNPEVQFYANRGYAVLQVNYRGSGGYGDAFEAAGFKKWGLEMQDDLTDGVRWAIAEGIADPHRVVISGASYGGYATMAGLVFTPELYAAGINYVGVVDINNLIPRSLPASRMHWMHTRLGDLGNAEDRKRIRETSPVHFADRIRAPLLMAYGRNDPRVPIEQAHDVERALRRSGVPYELIIERAEGHGFAQEDRRIAFYERIDAFLKQHLRPSSESDG